MDFNKSGCSESHSVHDPDGYMAITGNDKTFEQLERGDLVYFIYNGSYPNHISGHVGIYLGNNRMLDANGSAVVERDWSNNFPNLPFIGGGTLPEDLMANATGKTEANNDDKDEEDIICDTDGNVDTDAPESDDEVSESYKQECINHIKQAGSDTKYALVIDTNNARINLLIKSGKKWKFARTWYCWVGMEQSDGRSKTAWWEGDWDVDHKDANAGTPGVNDWFTVFAPVKVPGNKVETAGGYLHPDGTAENGNGIHDVGPTWTQDHAADLTPTANPKNRWTTVGGVKTPHEKAKWIYDSIPVKSRVSVMDIKTSPDATASTSGTINDGSLSAKQQDVISACKSVPSPGGGLCAAWVSQVLYKAGVKETPDGLDANDYYNQYCTSSNKSELKPGMVIAVSTHPHTKLGGIYGHVGIYIGDGQVMDNIGGIRTISVDEWIDYYGNQGEGTVPAKWGWYGGKDLTK